MENYLKNKTLFSVTSYILSFVKAKLLLLSNDLESWWKEGGDN